MTKCYIDPFIVEDLFGFEPLIEFPDLKENMINNLLDESRALFSVMCMTTREVVAICGMNTLRIGAVEVWSIRSKNFEKFKHEYFRVFYRFIRRRILSEDSGIYRVEIAIDCSEPEYKKWAEKLGGTLEGKVKNYCDGKDHFVFSITREKK